MTNRKVTAYSFLISFIYVGIATVSVLGIYPESIFYWEGSLIGVLVTLPVSVVSFGINYSEKFTPLLLILSVQILMFVLMWILLFFYLRKRCREL